MRQGILDARSESNRRIYMGAAAFHHVRTSQPGSIRNNPTIHINANRLLQCRPDCMIHSPTGQRPLRPGRFCTLNHHHPLLSTRGFRRCCPPLCVTKLPRTASYTEKVSLWMPLNSDAARSSLIFHGVLLTFLARLDALIYRSPCKPACFRMERSTDASSFQGEVNCYP